MNPGLGIGLSLASLPVTVLAGWPVLSRPSAPRPRNLVLIVYQGHAGALFSQRALPCCGGSCGCRGDQHERARGGGGRGHGCGAGGRGNTPHGGVAGRGCAGGCGTPAGR
jgi:hypothetical protein